MAGTLIVYYSLEGNADFVARHLARELDAQTLRLETVKEYPVKGPAKFLHGGRDATFGVKPELKTVLPDFAAYDMVVVGTPVWAGRPSAPVATLLSCADFSGLKVAAFACSGGGSTKKTLDTIAAGLKGVKLLATESFVNPARTPEDTVQKIKDFAQRLKSL